VALLRGPRERNGEKGLTMSDFWSGTKKYFGTQNRPKPGEFNMINNQGGWMGTRQQIWEWHTGEYNWKGGGLLAHKSVILTNNFSRNMSRWISPTIRRTTLQLGKWNVNIVSNMLTIFLPLLMTRLLSFFQDGLDPRNVEFWSGGLNLFTARHACNMQRLVSLDPDDFSKQLIYHSANNKQRQLSWRQKSFVKINDFFGQLITVSHDAEEKMKEMEKSTR
jgi:hypothetical protein